jgi:hypothetical protein
LAAGIVRDFGVAQRQVIAREANDAAVHENVLDDYVTPRNRDRAGERRIVDASEHHGVRGRSITRECSGPATARNVLNGAGGEKPRTGIGDADGRRPRLAIGHRRKGQTKSQYKTKSLKSHACRHSNSRTYLTRDISLEGVCAVKLYAPRNYDDVKPPRRTLALGRNSQRNRQVRV